MRVCCRRIEKHLFNDEYLNGKKLLIKTTYAHKRYVGVYNSLSHELNDVTLIAKSIFVEGKDKLIIGDYGYHFPIYSLREKCTEVFEIDDKSFELFKKCKNIKSFNLLFDNIEVF